MAYIGLLGISGFFTVRMFFNTSIKYSQNAEGNQHIKDSIGKGRSAIIIDQAEATRDDPGTGQSAHR